MSNLVCRQSHCGVTQLLTEKTRSWGRQFDCVRITFQHFSNMTRQQRRRQLHNSRKNVGTILHIDRSYCTSILQVSFMGVMVWMFYSHKIAVEHHTDVVLRKRQLKLERQQEQQQKNQQHQQQRPLQQLQQPSVSINFPAHRINVPMLH